MNTHSKGLLITAFGVLVLSLDGLLIRLIEMDPWTQLFWRSFLLGTTLLLVEAIATRGDFIRRFRRHMSAGLFISLIFAIEMACFLVAIMHTSVANTLIIFSATPFFAAFLSWLVLGERPPNRTLSAIGIAIVGIALVFAGSLDTKGIFGDFMALCAALMMAIALTSIRANREVSMVPSMGLGGLLCAIGVFCLAHPRMPTPSDVLWVGLNGIVVLPVGMGLVTLSPRYLPSPETALIMLLETVLGTLWVALAIGETPGLTTLIGGGIVILALVGHSILALRSE